MNKSRNKVSTFKQRVAWLISHWDHIEGMKIIDVLRMMKRDGLIAKTTYLPDCKFTKEFLAAKFAARRKNDRLHNDAG